MCVCVCVFVCVCVYSNKAQCCSLSILLRGSECFSSFYQSFYHSYFLSFAFYLSS